MQIKSPLIKKLRKAGYSTSEAKAIYLKALAAYKNDRPYSSMKNFHKLASLGRLSYMFGWSTSEGGHHYWSKIDVKLGN